MSANKENVKTNERKISTMKGNKKDLSERNPLKTSFHSNAEYCLAGPSSSSKLDTRYVTHRNHCEELDRGFMLFKDISRKLDRNDNKDKYEINEKTDSKRLNKHDLAEKEASKINKTEKEPSYREWDPEYYQSASEKYESNGEKKTEDAIQVHPDKRTEKIQPNKENIICTIDLTKEEDKTDKEDIETEITESNDDNVRLAPVGYVVLKNTPLVIEYTPKVEIYPTKRVKRSLKRPLARLLNTTSPVSTKSYQFSIYSSNDIKVPNLSVGKCFDPLNEAYMMDNLNYLLQTEKKVLGEPKIRGASRSCVINWIINVNGSSGNPAVVQLASWYFDCYLRSVFVTVDRLQVIAAACFWIATKYLHGHIVSGKRLVKYSGHAFIEMELVDAERTILEKLGFQALPVVPHDYVPYLVWCCDDTNSGLMEAAAVFLCQCGILTDKTLSEEYPSVVAAAAVKNALILLRMEASMHKLSACPIFKAAMKKAVNLDTTCAQLRNAVRVVASLGYEYKAPLYKFSGPPHYISTKIVRAVNHKDIVLMDHSIIV